MTDAKRLCPMPTLLHHALVEMFRERPTLVPRVLTMLFHVELPPYATIAVVEPTLDQLIPVEFRADLVYELRDEHGVPRLAIVFEVQRATDPRKKLSWPVYLCAERSKKGCDVVLLVIAPDPVVAAWAAEDIDLGLGRSFVRPLVLGPSAVPEIVDPAIAKEEVELSVLSALAHGNGQNGLSVLKAALIALEHLDREHAMVYFQVVYDALREPLRKAVEAMVMERPTEVSVEFEAFIERISARTRQKAMLEGELLGRREGELLGRREGELLGLRDALLRLIARASIPLSDEDRVRIQACTDPTTLERWIENVLGAKTIADILS